MSSSKANEDARWSEKRDCYTCADCAEVQVRLRKDSRVEYEAGKAREPDSLGRVRVAVSSVCTNRRVQTVVRLRDGAREASLPRSARAVWSRVARRCPRLRSVVFNEGLERLGEDDPPGAFAGSDLREVRLPGTLQKIGSRAFADCQRLVRVWFPDGLLVIGSGAFTGCANLRSVSLSAGKLCLGKPAGVVRMPVALRVPDDVQEILPNPAYAHFGLQEVVLGKRTKLERVAAGAFAGTQLESFTGPSSLREVGPFAFFGCPALKRVKLGSRVSVGDHCFLCSTFQPQRLSSLGAKTKAPRLGFSPEALRTLAIPSCVHSVPAGAFKNSALKEVDIGGVARGKCLRGLCRTPTSDVRGR